MVAAIQEVKIQAGTKVDDVYGDKKAESKTSRQNGDHNLFKGPEVHANNTSYYPGLTLDKITDNNDKETFTDIDGDKTLSSEKITLYSDKQEVEKLKRQKNSYKRKYDINTEEPYDALKVAGLTLLVSLLGGPNLFACGCLILFVTSVFAVSRILDERDRYKKQTAPIDKQINELECKIEKGTAKILKKDKKS